ncbi:hypothetical protein BDA96_07G108200 [Sorghum bicolor]|nr:hypothetical protein BDA96_07G108200 [Sorghum bicolor]
MLATIPPQSHRPTYTGTSDRGRVRRRPRSDARLRRRPRSDEVRRSARPNKSKLVALAVPSAPSSTSST